MLCRRLCPSSGPAANDEWPWRQFNNLSVQRGQLAVPHFMLHSTIWHMHVYVVIHMVKHMCTYINIWIQWLSSQTKRFT